MLGVLPLPALLEVLDYVGTTHLQFICMSAVCRNWRDALDDEDIWKNIARKLGITLTLLQTKSARATRCRANAKRQFLLLFGKRNRTRREAHEKLLLEIKKQLVDNTSTRNQDKPGLLRRLIGKLIEDVTEFDVNYQSALIEGNCLLTLVSRGSNRLKCIKLLVETYGANIEAREAGGFTALLLNAYSDNLSCVQYLTARGANTLAVGSERSGLCLTAEHWSAIKKGYRRSDTSCWFLNSRRRERVASKAPRKRALEHSEHSIPFFNKLSEDQELAPSFATTRELASWLAERKTQWGAARAAPRGFLAHPLATPPLSSSSDYSKGNSSGYSTSNNDCSNNSGSGNGYDIDSYCICGLGDVCPMICCDCENCPISWYHLECVGLPESDYSALSWTCVICRSPPGAPPARFPQPLPSPSSIFATHRSAARSDS